MARSKRQRNTKQRGNRPAAPRPAPSAPKPADGTPVRPLDEERRLWWLREALLAEPTLSRDALVAKQLERVRRGELSDAAPLPEDQTERSRELAFRAFEAADDEQAKRLAREALGADPLATDAHLVLLRTANLPLEEQLEPLETIASAARDLLGADALERAGSAPWHDCRMRPYLRAVSTLAAVAGRVGDRPRATEAYATLAYLDPSNRFRQQQRHVLQLLAAERRDEAFAALGEAADPASLWARAFTVASMTDAALTHAQTAALFEAADTALPTVADLATGAEPFPDALDLDAEPGSPGDAALTADLLLEVLEHSPDLTAIWSAWAERAES